MVVIKYTHYHQILPILKNRCPKSWRKRRSNSLHQSHSANNFASLSSPISFVFSPKRAIQWKLWPERPSASIFPFWIVFLRLVRSKECYVFSAWRSLLASAFIDRSKEIYNNLKKIWMIKGRTWINLVAIVAQIWISLCLDFFKKPFAFSLSGSKAAF